MTAETDIAAIGTGQPNTALEVRTALTSVLNRAYLPNPGLKPPDTPNASDIEFSRYANGTNPTAAPLSMSWCNQGTTATTAITGGRLLIDTDGTTAGVHGLVVAAPSGVDYTFTTRAEGVWLGQNHGPVLVGITGTPGSPTGGEGVGLYFWGTGDSRFHASTYNSSMVATADRATQTNAGWSDLYLQLAWTQSSGTITYRYSPTGLAGSWIDLTSAAGLAARTYIGLFSSNTTGGAAARFRAWFSFLRRDWTADFDPTS